MDLLSLLRSIYHQIYSTKCTDGLLSPISDTVVRSGAAVVSQKLAPCKKIQNRAARIVNSSPYYASAAPIIQDLGCFTIKDLIRKEKATLTYKSLNLLAPGCLRRLFSKCSAPRERVLRSSYTIPKRSMAKKLFHIEVLSQWFSTGISEILLGIKRKNLAIWGSTLIFLVVHEAISLHSTVCY